MRKNSKLVFIVSMLVVLSATIFCSNSNKNESNNSNTETKKKSDEITRNVTVDDKNKDNIISYERIEDAGKKQGSRTVNDFISINLYVEDYNENTCKELFDYYVELYKPVAAELNDLLSVHVSIWTKKIKDTDLDNPKNQDYSKGGFVYNYIKPDEFLNCKK